MTNTEVLLLAGQIIGMLSRATAAELKEAAQSEGLYLLSTFSTERQGVTLITMTG